MDLQIALEQLFGKEGAKELHTNKARAVIAVKEECSISMVRGPSLDTSDEKCKVFTHLL